MVKERLSNMELLRILSMMMILGVHIDGASLGLPEINGNLSELDSRKIWQILIESLTIIGVNCFTLISGYFGIKLRWKTVGKYLFECIFYSVGIYTGISLLSPLEFTWLDWIESWLVLTHTDLWYVPAYFILMLLAPFINAGFEMMHKNRSVIITIGFLLLNVWAGWWWEGKFNPTGYTVIQLILMYMVGRCISIFLDSKKEVSLKFLTVAIIAYFILTLFTSLYACWNPAKAYAYNSPIVIAESVAFFSIFVRIKFRSKIINYIALSAFSVYLIHKSPLIWGNIMRPSVIKLWNSMNLFNFTVLSIGMIVGIYLFCMILDSFRRWISSKLFGYGNKIFTNSKIKSI